MVRSGHSGPRLDDAGDVAGDLGTAESRRRRPCRRGHARLGVPGRRSRSSAEVTPARRSRCRILVSLTDGRVGFSTWPELTVDLECRQSGEPDQGSEGIPDEFTMLHRGRRAERAGHRPAQLTWVSLFALDGHHGVDRHRVLGVGVGQDTPGRASGRASGCHPEFTTAVSMVPRVSLASPSRRT